MNGKVLILIAIYNGEEFLKEELESIEKQTYTNWNLLISDDHSTDRSLDIIHSFMDNDPRISLITNESGWKSAHGNFRNAVLHGEDKERYDYFMFCDSDDIWKPYKIEQYVQKAELVRKEKGNVPLCFTCNMEIIDQDGKLIDPDFASTYHYQIDHPMDCFFSHRVFGCNLFFDEQVYLGMKKLMAHPDYNRTISHDNFCYQVAVALGADLSFIPEVLMSYRRHGGNSTANAVYKVNAGYFARAVTSVKLVIKQYAYISRVSIDTIDLLLKLDLAPEMHEQLKEIRKALEKGGPYAGRILRKYHVKAASASRTAANYLFLTLGLEKKYMDRKKYPELL